MALIKCPECGRENVSDTAKACPGCGYGIREHFDKSGREVEKKKEISTEEITEPITEQAQFSDGTGEENTIEPVTDAPNKKAMYVALGIIVLIPLIIIIIVIVSENAKRCSYYKCDNYKIEGSNYCSRHTCGEEGCTLSKFENNTYCYMHEKEHACAVDGCDDSKVSGGKYCYEHTCKQTGCYNKKYFGSDYCSAHQVNMRERLTDSSFDFSLNSAGGIKFSFYAKNSTGKEIKYVRFDVTLKNAVGDLVKDEIKNSTSVRVEIIGPVKSGGRVSMTNEIIGYCDTCSRIDINNITIIYTDGTSETGHFGYYYEYKR